MTHQNTQQAHTPDWKVGEFTDGSIGIFENGLGVARVLNGNLGLDKKHAKTTAAFIVTACNSHYELVEALKEIEEIMASIEEAEKDKKLPFAEFGAFASDVVGDYREETMDKVRSILARATNGGGNG